MIAGTVDIQGLVAIQRSDDMQAVYIAWMCTAPQNKKQMMNYNLYLDSLKNMPEPIMLNQMHTKMNLKKLAEYAKEKGVRVSSLSIEEMKKFVI